MRFPVLRDTIRYRMENVPKLIACCIGLHNFLINTGTEIIEDPENYEDEPVGNGVQVGAGAEPAELMDEEEEDFST